MSIGIFLLLIGGSLNTAHQASGRYLYSTQQKIKGRTPKDAAFFLLCTILVIAITEDNH